jgi:GxxExxY protein
MAGKTAGGFHAKDAKGAKVDEAPNDLRLALSWPEQSLAQGGETGQFCRPMNTNSQPSNTENQLSKIILDAAFKVHTKSGPGLLETVYEVVLAHELRKQGLRVERQVPIRICYDELVFDEGFRADLLVEDKVIVELKSVEQLARVHSKQVLTQLRLSQRRLGLLINFGEVHLKNGIERIVNGLPEERPMGLGLKLLAFFASLASFA